jgi:hypothetical protein
MRRLRNYTTTLATMTLLGCQTLPEEKPDRVVPFGEEYKTLASQTTTLNRLVEARARLIKIIKQNDGTFTYEQKLPVRENKARFERNRSLLLRESDQFDKDRFISPGEMRRARNQLYQFQKSLDAIAGQDYKVEGSSPISLIGSSPVTVMGINRLVALQLSNTKIKFAYPTAPVDLTKQPEALKHTLQSVDKDKNRIITTEEIRGILQPVNQQVKRLVPNHLSLLKIGTKSKKIKNQPRVLTPKKLRPRNQKIR